MAQSHGHFVWYELLTTDAEAATAFYAKVVGWGTQDASTSGAAYTFFTVGDAPVGGLMTLPADARRMGAEPRWVGYVSVDDVDGTVDRLKQLGGAVYVPPTDIPGISRFSVVADPQTAPLTLVKWLNPGQELPAEAGRSGHVGWHELLAADGDRAFAFYRELFGWQRVSAETDAMGTYQQFSVGSQTLGGMCTKPTTVPNPFWLYYFNSGDIDAAAERVKSGGGQILEGPVEMAGGGRVVRCMDPQGAMFALTGKRSDKPIGYFEPAAATDPSASRSFIRRSE